MGEDDARAVIAAFNALFGRRDEAQFIACGDISAVLAAERIRDQLDGGDEDEVALIDMVDEGRFDADDPNHLGRARKVLSSFPRG